MIIEEGDIFEITLFNGAKENYEVFDRGFYKGMHGISGVGKKNNSKII